MRHLWAVLACIILACSCGCGGESTRTDVRNMDKLPPPTGTVLKNVRNVDNNRVD
jgi:hypothetical protein